jgi:hypothetical protein
MKSLPLPGNRSMVANGSQRLTLHVVTGTDSVNGQERQSLNSFVAETRKIDEAIGKFIALARRMRFACDLLPGRWKRPGKMRIALGCAIHFSHIGLVASRHEERIDFRAATDDDLIRTKPATFI